MNRITTINESVSMFGFSFGLQLGFIVGLIVGWKAAIYTRSLRLKNWLRWRK